jgi:hypothetical protein
VAPRRVEPMGALIVVLAARMARVSLTVARRPVEPMVVPTVALVDWVTAKVWLMAGPPRAQATAERTAAPVAEGSSGSW